MLRTHRSADKLSVLSAPFIQLMSSYQPHIFLTNAVFQWDPAKYSGKWVYKGIIFIFFLSEEMNGIVFLPSFFCPFFLNSPPPPTLSKYILVKSNSCFYIFLMKRKNTAFSRNMWDVDHEIFMHMKCLHEIHQIS